MYANTSFLMGAWERCVRDWIGLGADPGDPGFPDAVVQHVGDTMCVHAVQVASVRRTSVVTVAIRCENSAGVTVGPGTVEVCACLAGSGDMTPNARSPGSG